ncbi:TAT-variant-translocated molybdopterin oxidoreductase [Flavobacterium gilvum]|uniref:Quinol:cytochrome C oxidoreductase n=1 Tax=Flavobacterium gilvum TaxID=1492737 RepID=A0AAC9I5C0_9FLAO|nr:TAT-variant-translocated molybdopterin oxidoreductase [Flavobacterium gilvum]AOW09153.1 quinol:cytochrome C oxidoreductase [Flavobacterium gilvum]KFC60874.1 quinol:cytochrome C oxidoreductase [Flavobacterium gilvum]
MSSNKKYWKSVEELDGNSSIVEALRNNEFVEEIPTDEFLGNEAALSSSSTTRRDFLKYVGFSTAAASLAACEGPVHFSIPYVQQPEQIIPGVADYYATSVFDGFDFANLLVKTREGRPIKIDNNTIAGAKFAANARVHGSILSLYDSMRLKEPKIDAKNASWSAVDSKIKSSIVDAKAKGGQVVLLTNTLASPSTEKLIADFIAKNPNAKHVIYDAVSSSEALDAFEAVYGERALVDYDFSKASTIVSVGADFLGDWQGGGYDSSYAKGRIPSGAVGKKTISKHIQLESNMTLSGAAADKRIAMSTANQKQALVQIYNVITGSSIATSLDAAFKADVTKAAQQLKAGGSKSVLVSGIQDKNAQLLVLAINQVLSSEAFVTSGTRQIRKGSNEKVAQLIKDMNAGTVHTLIMSGVNPVYTLADSKLFVEGLKKVKASVSLSLREDETASLSTIAAPVPHYLEAWGDLTLTKGTYNITQPTIRPLFNTKQFQDILLSLNGIPGTYYDYLKAFSPSIIAGTTWNKVLHDGVYVGVIPTAAAGTADYNTAASTLAQAKPVATELVLYTKTGMGDGQQANNPWLQEFPDPLTRVSWDNYVTVSNADAKKLGLSNEIVANGGLNGSYATLTVNGVKLENVPVIVQPGQAVGTIGMALGYGRKAALKEEMQVGINAYALYAGFNNVQSVTIEKANGVHEFACVQGQKTLMGRGDIIKETTLEIFNTKDAEIWNEKPEVSLDHKEVKTTEVDLWGSFDRSTGHHFNLSIDLNACTGCGACVIACHAENNVPVVGKSEVRRSRDMHWLRIDRYYSSESTFEGDNERKEHIAGLGSSLSTFNEMEKAGDNPQVAFQPVMCQHCNHAPCETVCPVAATSHGRQGQNQMAYNRCVGTRYCANNCPYKVRRFNWFLYNKNSEFDYHMNDDLGRMVLNPDVNVRSRGVMEKCSMCIQMTQATILKAKNEGRAIKDGEFQTACSNACSTGAMIFGDVNDKESVVAKLAEDDRSYHLLEHVGTRPNVVYHVKVRNT